MDQRGLKQSDLGDLIAQPNLSAILNGHRSISRDLAKALAQRFNVSVDVFL
jgi:antitoxin component HigA of HigAB toxin-antitoxin module